MFSKALQKLKDSLEDNLNSPGTSKKKCKYHEKGILNNFCPNFKKRNSFIVYIHHTWRDTGITAAWSGLSNKIHSTILGSFQGVDGSYTGANLG